LKISNAAEFLEKRADFSYTKRAPLDVSKTQPPP